MRAGRRSAAAPGSLPGRWDLLARRARGGEGPESRGPHSRASGAQGTDRQGGATRESRRTDPEGAAGECNRGQLLQAEFKYKVSCGVRAPGGVRSPPLRPHSVWVGSAGPLAASSSLLGLATAQWGPQQDSHPKRPTQQELP